jgi:DNA-binding NtrC family response regulator
MAAEDFVPLPQPDCDTATLVGAFARLNLIGSAPKFVEALRLLCHYAACDVPVLIAGETGTGKELAARALHYLSARSGRSFIPVNCGALPQHLFENELFGHERGAFTDAHAAQKGLIAQANGGTLLLDEVDSLSLKGQVALLRFLQDGQYRPLGGERSVAGNVRIVAATNADLRARVAEGTFRQDLYFRLDVANIRLPCLRERAADIPLLARHAAHRLAARYGRPVPDFDSGFLADLCTRPWPGNVRELENAVHRALLLAGGGIMQGAEQSSTPVSPTDLAGADFVGGLKAARARLTRDFDKRYLTWVMMQTRGNVTAAAQRAGTERRQLGRLLQRYGIDKDSFRNL